MLFDLIEAAFTNVTASRRLMGFLFSALLFVTGAGITLGFLPIAGGQWRLLFGGVVILLGVLSTALVLRVGASEA
ncbi:MAG: hypothetical protein AAF662_01505 [Pseudomonadota bacterium]